MSGLGLGLAGGWLIARTELRIVFECCDDPEFAFRRGGDGLVQIILRVESYKVLVLVEPAQSEWVRGRETGGKLEVEALQ